MPDLDKPVLHVCVTCRAGTEPMPDQPVPGRVLYQRLETLVGARGGPVDLRPVECLAGCDHGCTAAIALPGKWRYLIGRMSPDQAEDLLAYAEAYAASRSGAVLPSRRPASLAHALLGRFPALEIS